VRRRTVDDIHRVLTRETIGKRLRLQVLRDGALVDLTLVVAVRPEERLRA